MSNRKLWKVVHPGRSTTRPESKVKAYGIYVANARQAYEASSRNPLLRYVVIYVDERDGYGFKVYERLDLAEVTA